MSKFTKLCVALIAVYLLLGCATPLQQIGQIQCTGHDGHIIYTGPYDGENLYEYVVWSDDLTRDFYPKGACQKVSG